VFCAEGGGVGPTLVTASYTVNATRVTDTVRLTVLPYPDTIDVDIDSDNNNDFVPPARSEWEDFLEDHEYGVGKLIMLDNPQRGVTPIVLEIAAGLPVNSPAVGVLIDWDEVGPAGWVRLWNTSVADASRNPGSVHDGKGGNYIAPDFVCKLADLNYNPQTGTIMIWAEGIRENEQLKTLAGVEAARRVDERIRGTLVVNGDDAAFDEVKYIVANEDSFYHALHTRQEVRNALASRGVYEFADMPKFSLERKSPKALGAGDSDTFPLSPDVPGFKAMVYQDYITGKDQYVLAFGGTDDTFLEAIKGGGDWSNNWNQVFGHEIPQYDAAMEIADSLIEESNIPKGHLVVTGHSLGGGLASAAAVVAGAPADTFNAAGLNARTLLSPEGSGAQYDPMEALYEIYPGSLANLYGAASTVDAYFVDYDILTRGQQVAFLILDKIPIAVVGAAKKLDGPYDSTMALTAAGMATLVAGGPSATAIALGSGAYAIKIMVHCHSMDVVLYGLLVTEVYVDPFGMIGPKVDMLGYTFADQ